ncbi:MAG: mechanosensitive ion channel family protein [Treponema sp.]|nr:mechanosensitive ion channel family protein [Treponema sp.]
MEEELNEASEVLKSEWFFDTNTIRETFTLHNVIHVAFSVLSVIAFFAIYKFICHLINKNSKDRINKHTSMLINKFVKYTFYIFLIMYILGLFGINLKALWGAAGVAGIAVGFAAQTSVSNLISGMFLLGEKTIKIGDFISVGGVSGTVESVGLLRIQVYTLDNQVVRIPNSSVINSNLTNFSTLPIRRFVFEVPVSYETDMTAALEAVKKVPECCPTVLQDPAPSVFYDGFGDYIKLQLAVWFKGSDLIQTKNDVYINIVKECKKVGIEIPYTHYDVKILKN